MSVLGGVDDISCCGIDDIDCLVCASRGDQRAIGRDGARVDLFTSGKSASSRSKGIDQRTPAECGFDIRSSLNVTEGSAIAAIPFDFHHKSAKQSEESAPADTGQIDMVDVRFVGVSNDQSDCLWVLV